MHSPERRSPSGIAGPRRPGRSISSRGRPAVQSGSRGPHGPPPRPLEPAGTHTAEGPPRGTGAWGWNRRAPGAAREGRPSRARGPGGDGLGVWVGGRPRPGRRGAGVLRLHHRGGPFRRARGWRRPRPQRYRAETQNCPLPARRRQGGGGIAAAGIKGLKRNLDSSLPRYVTRRKGGRLSPSPPHPLLCFPTSPPPNVPPQGTGLPAAGRNSTQITWSGELGRGATRGVGGPSPGGCAGSPSPEPGERRGAGGAPRLGDTAERPGAGGRSGGPGGEGQEGPGTPLGAPRRGRGAWAPGVPGPGRGRAPHSPSCRRRRPRPRPARSRPPSTCSRRCPAPTGRRSTGASASAAASSRLGRRPRPLLASLPGAAAGAGRGGAEEGEGRGGSSSGAAGGEGGARPAPELRPGRERRAAPEQEAAAAEAARGSGSKGRPIGGGCGGPARAEEGITASPPRRRAGPTGRASAGRRPATPVSDRWPPGARGARAHVRTHTGARTRDPRSLLPRAARAGAPLPRSSVFGTTPAPWQARSYWPTDLSFLVQIPHRDPTWLPLAAVFLLILQQNIPGGDGSPGVHFNLFI